jgi:protein gp37
MADTTKIEWTDATWNPITGCTVLTPGCTNCYAMRLAGTRLRNHPSRRGLTTMTKAGPVWNGKVRLNDFWLDQPLKWKRPRMIFTCAHGDLFHESISYEWIDKVLAVMALTPHHTFQVLTKRAERMRDYCSGFANVGRGFDIVDQERSIVGGDEAYFRRQKRSDGEATGFTWPSRNVWLGVSCERQKEAEERIPFLLQTPAAIRFISAEPLLGPIHLRLQTSSPSDAGVYRTVDALTGKRGHGGPCGWTPAVDRPSANLDWVIVGGESGPGFRPMQELWASDIVEECTDAGIAVFVKQMAGKAPIPPDLLIRQFPNKQR